MASNFDFLEKYWPDIAQIGKIAEMVLFEDANTCIFKLGLLAERIAQEICGFEKITLPERTTHADRLRSLKYADILPKPIDELFYTIRKARNDAVHEGLNSFDKARDLLQLAFHLCCWFMDVYGDWDFQIPTYQEPENTTLAPDYQKILQAQEAKILELSKAVEEIRTAASSTSRAQRAQRADIAAQGLALTGLAGGVSIRMDAVVLPVINYAIQQNGVTAIRSITIENHTEQLLENATLTITASPDFAVPFSQAIGQLPAGKTLVIQSPKLLLRGEFLSELTERVNGYLHVALVQNQQELAAEDEEISVLAFDEWHGMDMYPELLSAFVTPNHPDLAPLIVRASDYMAQWTGDTSMDGYQSQDANRVLQQAAALYSAIKEQRIVYTNPPASFERVGQRVRLCDRVLQQKLGTCLDLALLYASCLEAVGLHPLLVTTYGHIFAGVWLENQMFPECVQDDASLITKRLASGVNEIAVVETTYLTTGTDASFDDACKQGEHNLTQREVEYILDVYRGRMSLVHPLPLRVQTPSGWTVQHVATIPQNGGIAPAQLKNAVQLDTPHPEAEMPKMVQWERKLLDLGMRNTLINLRFTRTQLPILANSLDELENALADGSDFTILPKPSDWKNEVASFEALHELRDAGVLKAEFENKRLRSALPEGELNRSIKELYRTSKVALEENGANTLYLALGMLRWFESPHSTKARYAPIILLPIEMVKKSAAQGYIIRLRDDDPQVNVTLLEKMKQDFGIEVKGVDPLPMDAHGIDIRRVLTILRKAVMNQPHWDVLEAASMGIFFFSQFVMWNDIRSRTQDLVQNKVVRSLMEGKLCWDAQPLQMGDSVNEDHVLLPMPADASQLYAIQAACSGQSFVLHGPPGTGKSQTITSLIANALSQGKSVLFVAEKIAALQVVQKRLDSIGIGPFCLELHSNKSRKRDVLNQLREAAETVMTQPLPAYAARAEQLAALRGELDAYAHALHKPLPCGFDLYTLIHTYEACKSAPDIPPFAPDFIRGLSSNDLDGQQLAVERWLAAAQAVGNPSIHPLNRIGCGQYSQQLRAALPGVIQTYATQLAQLSPHADILCRMWHMDVPRTFSDVQKLVRRAELLSPWYCLPVAWPRAEFPQKYFDEVAQLARHSRAAQQLEQQILAGFDIGFLQLDADALSKQLAEVSGKWFLPKWLGMNKLVKSLSVYAKVPLDKEAAVRSIGQLRVYQAEKQQADQLLTVYGPDLGMLYQGAATDWADIETKANTAQKLTRALWDSEGSFTLLQVYGGKLEWKESILALEQGMTDLIAAKTGFDILLGIGTGGDLPFFQDQMALCQRVLDHVDDVKDWMAYVGARDAVVSLGLGNVADLLARDGLADGMGAYRKALLMGLITCAVDDSSVLNQFSGVVFNEKINQFKRMDKEWTRLSREEVFCRLASRVPDLTREAAHSSELGILQRCIRSGGRGTSIRKLFDQIPNLLPKLCPCMLMSPISAAQYLDPKREPFDIVVFDEASQLPTCKAVGVLARGKNAIVVGDPKQMPPTSFFNVNTVDEDHLDTEDLESILDDCLALNMPQSHLLWHYRSRHESLIAFSNTQFYENRLLTFPSIHDRASKVQLVHVDGVFDRGKTRTNRAEAEAVVQEILRRYHDSTLAGQSLGVVTFNIAQQHLIDDLLNDACTQDEALEKWAFDRDEPLFIKNLENVQGDERDVVLFSLGYGPDEQGKVYMNFGPLNREGGWRRLNVAVSRARFEMVVFSTLLAEQIDLNRTRSEGVVALRNFLEYAQGRTLMGMQVAGQGISSRDGVADAICAALGVAGYDTQQAVGRSKYRIDIGVVNPENPETYLLGILLDGDGYGTARTTRDREIAQISVLEGLGWNLMRVWSMDWWDNSNKELQRILDCLQELKHLQNKPIPAPAEVELPPIEDKRLAAKPAPVHRSAPLYRSFALPLTPLSAEDFVDPRYTREIRKRISQVINAESPVSQALLVRRVVQSFGITRAGSRMQGYLANLLSDMAWITTRQEDAVFYWKTNQEPDAYRGYRVSGDEEHHRDVKDVPVQEAANALYAVLHEQGSMAQDDLLRETARKLGYTRLGNNVLSQLSQSIGYAQARNGVMPSSQGSYVLTAEGTTMAEAVQRSY